MANQQHLELLLRGSHAWNEWREANPGIKPDLAEARLCEVELSGANLSGANLQGAVLKAAKLAGANLRRADLHGADLHGADLHSADLHRVILEKADLQDANLKQADVREADLREARLQGALLDGADLKGAVLNKDGMLYVSQYNDRLKQEPPPVMDAPAAKAASTVTKAWLPKAAFAGGGLALAIGLAALVATRPPRPAKPAVSDAVSSAVAAKVHGVDSVEIDGAALILRSGRENIESGMYLSLLKTACQALDELDDESALREIRIVNQSGEQGWIYKAPEKCGEILVKPPALTQLSIAAHTQPIQK